VRGWGVKRGRAHMGIFFFLFPVYDSTHRCCSYKYSLGRLVGFVDDAFGDLVVEGLDRRHLRVAHLGKGPLLQERHGARLIEEHLACADLALLLMRRMRVGGGGGVEVSVGGGLWTGGGGEG
jgi:hypothetical protein